MRGFLFIIISIINTTGCSIYQSEGRKQFESKVSSAELAQSLLLASCVGDYSQLTTKHNDAWILAEKSEQEEYWLTQNTVLHLQKYQPCQFSFTQIEFDLDIHQQEQVF